MSLLDKLRPPFLRPPPTDRPHARAERPYTHTTLPTAYTRPTDRPKPLRPTDRSTDSLDRIWEMSTERGGLWEPCSVLPMKLEGECRPRPGTERGGIISAQGSHTHLYTILYFTKRQQHEHAPWAEFGVAWLFYSIFCPPLWLRLDRTCMKLCFMTSLIKLNFWNQTIRLRLEYFSFFSLLSWVDPAK